MKKTGELGFIVWMDEEYPKIESVLIEMMGNVGPVDFYILDVFELVEE